ncbi:MAG TPA: hypothetical protein VGG42_06320 [Acidobacteriaceae bacterium]
MTTEAAWLRPCRFTLSCLVSKGAAVLKQGVELGDDGVGVAGAGCGIAPAHTGTVVGADPGAMGEGGLDSAPDEAIVAEAGIEDEGGGAVLDGGTPGEPTSSETCR